MSGRVIPENLAEAELVVREAAGARADDPVPDGFPGRNIIALSQVVAAILDDLTGVVELPWGEGYARQTRAHP